MLPPFPSCAGRSSAVLYSFALATLLLDAKLVHALPDLVPEIANVSVEVGSTVDPGDVAEGCAGAASGRKLLRFDLGTRNLGPSDLVLGDPGCPSCPDNPGASCAHPLFECSLAHGHAHFDSFAKSEILDSSGAVVASGRKYGFCLLDLECDDPQFTCGFQGISAGCRDVYSAGLPCQYVDLTDANLPNGEYTLRVTIDPDGEIPEANETNNVATAAVQIGAPPADCPVYPSADVPGTIADLATLVSTLTIPDDLAIDHVRVRLDGQHTYMGDLRIRLRSPAGTEITLADQVCPAFFGFHLDLADLADSPIQCPPTQDAVHQPSQPLAGLAGESSAGAWSLRIEDLAGGDVGTLDSWSVEVCSQCGNGALDPGEQCDDGNTDSGDCCSSDCQAPAANGTACSDGSACTPTDSCQAGSCAGTGSLSCDPCLTCDPALGCVPPTAPFCEPAAPGRSNLVLRDGGSNPERDSLRWGWSNANPIALSDFGSPSTATDLRLCVFDATGLRISSALPAAGDCGGKPCWSSTSRGHRYRDREATPHGVRDLTLRSGDVQQAKITARGQGANLGLGTLDWTAPITVRLRRELGPVCWQSVFSEIRGASSRTIRARGN